MAESKALSFQDYQRVFTQHIRNPKTQPRPMNVPAKRMAIYTEIVYNNIEGTLASCFPVAKSLLSANKWQQLVCSFMADYRASTPFFREIPQQFLQHLADADVARLKLPNFLTSLMHYEWVELLVSTMEDLNYDNATSANIINLNSDLLKHQPVFSSTLQLLSYDYPVHKISKLYRPKNRTDTQLLVYRDRAFAIKFIEINKITYELIALLQQKPLTGEQALTLIASKLNEVPSDNIMRFGLQILTDLKEQGVIVGVYTNPTQ
jgi:uncharacterized protein